MMIPLIMFRKINGEEMFYPIEVPLSVLADRDIREIAEDNAELNPGTLRVEDIEGRVLWPVTLQ